ncbi:MAG: hypothetical protein MZV70_75940 [Desulfobacterales bacterium]|nr:hypothetical protein [Desulfobacterales bacterium]
MVITSNAERRLPDAFLRRCIYHHIELTPELEEDQLRRWAKTRLPRYPDHPGSGVGTILGAA